MRRASLSLLVVLLGTGCNPRVFDRLKDDSPIVALQTPSGERDNEFGAVMVAYEGTFPDGRYVSRIAATGGLNSQLGVFAVWGPNGLELGDSLFDACGDVGSCRPGFGAAMGAVPEFNGERVCLIVGEPTEGALRVLCETMPGSSVQISPSAGTELGQSVAGIPTAAHPVGVAIVGAPGDVAGEGRIYVLADAAPLPTALPVPAEIVLAAGHRFGETIALHGTPTDVLVAVSAPGAGRVALLRIAAGPVVTAEACIDRTTPGFGAALAFGDLDMDGEPELAIGSDPDAVGRSEVVEVFHTMTLTGAEGCGGAAPALDDTPEPIACEDGLREVSCAGSGFGGALAIGDVDLDGFGDLLVGAPRATVSGKTEAGAAFLFAGSLAGTGADRVDALVHSDPGRDDRVGTQVAMASSHLTDPTADAGTRQRVEPVASAPGKRKLYVFLCTSLEQGDPSFANRCID